MIDQGEIFEAANETGLQPYVIEKDYVIGWVLAGIYNHPEIRNHWVFKGGTCLKKCFFDTYRFSEDLDFTLRDPSHLDEEFLARVLGEVADWVYQSSGVQAPVDELKVEVYTNKAGITGGVRPNLLQESTAAHEKQPWKNKARLNSTRSARSRTCPARGPSPIFR